MDFTAILREFGLEILIIFALAGVIVYLYRKIEALQQKLLDTSEARRDDALKTQEQLINTLSTFSQSSQLLIDKIVPVQEGRR